jgi:3-hydroxyacyl-[acyl-carrier-protein] dehydratase
MPASPLFDFSGIDLNRTVVSREQIYERLPHRYEFMQLDRFVYLDKPTLTAVAIREVHSDEFWVRGHIPGRPLLPGVLMIETAAQMAAYVSYLVQPSDRFIGFGGVDNVKFRLAVSPPARLVFLLRGVEVRPRRIVCDVQAYLDSQMAFEGRITGMPV